MVNKMKASEIRSMSAAELESKLVELKKDLFMLRMQHATNHLDNPVKISAVRRDIARVKTVLREKKVILTIMTFCLFKKKIREKQLEQ